MAVLPLSLKALSVGVAETIQLQLQIAILAELPLGFSQNLFVGAVLFSDLVGKILVKFWRGSQIPASQPSFQGSIPGNPQSFQQKSSKTPGWANHHCALSVACYTPHGMGRSVSRPVHLPTRVGSIAGSSTRP
jgi:hypothetical protein